MSDQSLLLAVGLGLAGLAAGYYLWLRPWMYRWGASPNELAMPLSGDVLAGFSSPVTTRAITIHAPAEHVWGWLSQIGKDHPDALHPLWQDLCVGDTLWLACGYGDTAAQQIAAVERDSYLVLVSPSDFRRLERGQTASGRWEFFLRPEGPDTRLIVRRCGDLLGPCVFDVAQFVMERRMMCGIRDRAQRSWAAKHSSG